MTTLQLAYLGLTLIMLFVLIFIGTTAIRRSSSQTIVSKHILVLVGGLLFWQLYTYLLDLAGVTRDLGFPPRFAVFLIIPLFIFTGWFFSRNKNKRWIRSIPEHWLIFYQSLRIAIETIFAYSVTAGVLHPNVTIEGYNFDMVLGYSAPIIGYLLYRYRSKFRKAALAWNYLGLAVIASIIFLFISTIYMPALYGPNPLPFPIEATFYPYVLVAGFLMPSAVFIHVWSIIQLRKPTGHN